MRSWSTIIFLIIYAIGAPGYAVSEKEAATVFAKTYAEEQIKYQVAEFINKNPGILSSVNPQAGTEAIRFIGRILAAHELLTAKSDKDRAWAAAHLILAPDPTTALLMVAVQLADTLVSLNHQKQIIQIDKQINAVNLETIHKLRLVYESQYRHRAECADRFVRVVQYLGASYKETLQFIAQHSEENWSESDMAQLIQSIFEIENAILRLNIAYSHLESWVNIDEINSYLPTGSQYPSLAEIKNFVNGFRETQMHIEKLGESIQHVFVVSMGQGIRMRAEQNLSPYFAKLRIYERCASLLSQEDLLGLNLITEDASDPFLIQDCEAVYAKMHK